MRMAGLTAAALIAAAAGNVGMIETLDPDALTPSRDRDDFVVAPRRVSRPLTPSNRHQGSKEMERV